MKAAQQYERSWKVIKKRSDTMKTAPLTSTQLIGQSNSYRSIASEIADLVTSKQAAYGNSFGLSGNIMAILYPNGVRVDQLDDALCIVRIVDKLFRIATAKDALGEDPYKDIAGYALLGASRMPSKANNRQNKPLKLKKRR